MLKIIRILFSSFILISFLILFLKIENILFLNQFLNHTQIIPLFLNAFFNNNFISLLFLLLLILLTLILGRVYCSFLCPLGILQDFFIFLKNKIRKAKSEYFKNYGFIHYIFLVLIIVFLFLKKSSLVGLLDPYSVFGKIITNIFLPFLSFIFGNLKIFIFPEMHKINNFLFIYALIFLLVLILFSILSGRLYCNMICPVGAFLRLLSKKTLLNIKIDSGCVNCGLCNAQCKANCIDIKNSKVDNERCIRCFNCLYSCRKGYIKFERQNKKIEFDFKRREIIKKLTFFAFFSILKVDSILAKNNKINKKNFLITPPGSISLNNFNEKCIACHLCVAKCPTKVLTPAFYEYGISGIFQPRMDYEKSYCLYECNTCSIVCPTGAIKKITIEEKKHIQIGIAEYKKENCIVVNQETDCGVCSEFCPTKAVKLVHYKKDLYIPFVNKNICVGCGACEYVCPARPYKAIYVEGNKEHNIARKPGQMKRKGKKLKYEEFPF